MKRAVLLGLLPSMLLASAAAAQAMDPNMPGMATPAKPKPAAKSKAAQPKPARASAHAGHNAPVPSAGAATAEGHAGHAMPTAPAPEAPTDAHADHAMPMPATPGSAASENPRAGHEAADEAAPAEEVIPETPPPPPPTDHAADRDFNPAIMAGARTLLQHEHGDVRYSKVIAKLAEYQSRSGPDGYRWDGQASFGGDVNRLLLKSEGEGTRGEGVEAAELQALYSRAVTPFFDLHAGVRQDFKPRDRTYVTVGVEGLAPYWLDVEGAIFVSTKGEVLARAEGA